jgi:hypothetical protein
MIGDKIDLLLVEEGAVVINCVGVSKILAATV